MTFSTAIMGDRSLIFSENNQRPRDLYFSNFAAKQTLTMEQKLRIPTFT